MRSLLEIIKEAEKNKKAIGHFNISNLEALKAIVNVVKRGNTPVIIGVSEGERNYIGVKQIAALIKIYQDEGLEIFLNADHTKSLLKAKEAFDVGFDAITFDASGLSPEENIKQTKEVVAYSERNTQYIGHSAPYKKKEKKDVLIEGEINPIWGSSELLSQVPEQVMGAIRETNMTKPEQAEKFIKETGVDLLAIAVGNIHGIVHGERPSEFMKPKIDIERIKAIKNRTNVPLVLHGGSGIPDEDLTKAIEAGISVIHINTELRLAWKNSLEESLKNNPEEIVPYKIMPAVIADIENKVEEKLRIFNRL